jgi:Alpha-L-fucosidase
MKPTRRDVLKLAALPLAAQPRASEKFHADWDSLEQYRTPAWFRDAKLGFWAHWVRKVDPDKVTGTPATSTSRAPGKISITSPISDTPPKSATKT